MHSRGQQNTLFYHSKACLPCTSHVTLTIPASEQSLSASGPRMPAMTKTALISPIHPPPQRPSPSVTHHHPSRRHIPLPPTAEGYVELNPLLLSGPEALIRYTLVTPLTAASAFSNNVHWMLEPATSPKLSSMTIAASDLIPWPIIAHASDANRSVVTVGDVLAAVHDALHTLVTEYEYRLVLRPDTVARDAGSRYWNGMVRLDLLDGRHSWAGLSESLEGPEMWDLHLWRRND